MHCLTALPLIDCVGRGTGLDDNQLQEKVRILTKALQQSSELKSPLDILATWGGFEIAMMVGAILKAAELKLIVMIDGFIASSALLVAHKLYPQVLDYCVFSHVSNERGHRALLDFLNVRALLAMDLRLGEGSGAALAFPLLQSAVLFLKEMASFAEAGVDQ
jgi:nicotinate-nucleotide--dimethylbenzimidazole phosphoribosyltransferase